MIKIILSKLIISIFIVFPLFVSSQGYIVFVKNCNNKKEFKIPLMYKDVKIKLINNIKFKHVVIDGNNDSLVFIRISKNARNNRHQKNTLVKLTWERLQNINLTNKERDSIVNELNFKLNQLYYSEHTTLNLNEIHKICIPTRGLPEYKTALTLIKITGGLSLLGILSAPLIKSTPVFNVAVGLAIIFDVATPIISTKNLKLNKRWQLKKHNFFH